MHLGLAALHPDGNCSNSQQKAEWPPRTLFQTSELKEHGFMTGNQISLTSYVHGFVTSSSMAHHCELSDFHSRSSAARL